MISGINTKIKIFILLKGLEVDKDIYSKKLQFDLNQKDRHDQLEVKIKQRFHIKNKLSP